MGTDIRNAVFLVFLLRLVDVASRTVGSVVLPFATVLPINKFVRFVWRGILIGRMDDAASF